MFENHIIPNKLVPVFKPSLHRKILSVTGLAMVSRNRMQSLARLMHRIDRAGIRGDIVETGVARGGSAAFLAQLAAESPVERQLWLYDAFETYNKEGAGVYQVVSDTLYQRFHLDPNKVHLTQGWFQDTVPKHPDRPIALLHLDATHYEGVKCCLVNLMPKIAKGGLVVMDNYKDETVVRAWGEWYAETGQTAPLERFGHTQAYFFKA